MTVVGASENTALRALRVATGIRLRPLARDAGISAGHLSRIERGEARPSIPVVVRLAFALNVDPAEILAALPAEALFHDFTKEGVQ